MSCQWYGWKPDKPDTRDYQYKPTIAAWIWLPSATFLLPEWLPRIRNQGAQGSCTGHATGAAVHYARMRSGQQITRPSPRFIYWNGRVIEGTTQEDAGCEIRDVIKAVHKSGVCDEQLCPYEEDDYLTAPSEDAFTAAKADMLKDYYRVYTTTFRVRALKEALVRKNAVVFGFTVYENFESDKLAKTGEMEMPKGSVIGGHAVWLVGYDNGHGDGGAFRVANSWGEDWGDKGYFWMPYKYIGEPDLADDFWVLKVVS